MMVLFRIVSRSSLRFPRNSLREFSFQPDKTVVTAAVEKPVSSSSSASISEESRIRFNTAINLTALKVTDHITIMPGDKIALCRCWRSKKFPLCDGAHGPYNRECGDNLGPAVITVKSVEK